MVIPKNMTIEDLVLYMQRQNDSVKSEVESHQLAWN
jgi:hypothetical protein